MQGDHLNVIMLSDLSASFKGIFCPGTEVLCGTQPDYHFINARQKYFPLFTQSLISVLLSAHILTMSSPEAVCWLQGYSCLLALMSWGKLFIYNSAAK